MTKPLLAILLLLPLVAEAQEQRFQDLLRVLQAIRAGEPHGLKPPRIEGYVNVTSGYGLVDANGVALANTTDATDPVYAVRLAVGQYPEARAVLINNAKEETVDVMAYCATGTMLVYESADCSGQPFVAYQEHLVSGDGSQFFVATESAGERLLKSSTRGVCMNPNNDSVQFNDCKAESWIKEIYWPGIYTPAPEIRNAEYPMRLEQLP